MPNSNLDQILLERACKYGGFYDVTSRTARIYHHMVYNTPAFINKSDMSIYYEALHMIALKISRLVNGEIKDLDGWCDIAGYAMLVHNHIKAEEEAKREAKSPPPEAIFKSPSPILNKADKAAFDALEEEIAKDFAEAG